MSSRVAVVFAILLLIAANTVLLVLGDAKPGCTQYRVVYEPILCVPDQLTENCSAGMATYTTVKQWLIQTSLDGKYKASSPGQTYPMYPNAPPGFVWYSAEEDVIVPTGAVCGGRYVKRFQGNFGSQQSTNPEAFVIQQLDVLDKCSEEYNCYWVNGIIAGYKEIFPLGGGESYFVSHSQSVEWCDTDPVSVSPAMRITWRDAYWPGECLLGF